MDIDNARRIFSALETTGSRELRIALYQAAVRYAEHRARYALADAAEKAGIEDARTRAHDAFIDACNILSRNMASKGEDNSWRQSAGNDRKELGDLASYIQLFLALKAR